MPNPGVMARSQPRSAMSLSQRLIAEPLVETTVVRSVRIDKAGLRDGLTVLDEVMVWRIGAEVVVYDRRCDHAGGRLISRPGDVAACPLHGWVFDPSTGGYDNGKASKTPLPLIDMGDHWRAEIVTRIPRLPGGGDQAVTVRFLNHACLVVEGGGVRFATDPWLLGPAFCDGWWLARPSPADAVAAIDACDFLFISHNHPDHLHEETLAHIRRDMPILTAAFSTRSTELYLRDLGFTDILPAAFGTAYRDRDSGLALTVLKSGDFRDDSGLYFTIGDFSAVLTVDANWLNFGALPGDISLLATSFAGGASGFPLCFDTYDMDEKRRILARNRAAIMASVQANLTAARPAVYAPYAGFFTEDGERDGDISRHNAKNAVADYAPLAQRHGAKLVDLQATPVMRFQCGELVGLEPEACAERMPAEDRAARHRASAMRYAEVSDETIAAYFAGSGFRDDLILNLAITDDGFEPQAVFQIDFQAATPTTRRLEMLPDVEALSRDAGAQVSTIRARRPALVRTITEGLPWEDLSIGFQARFDRFPNTYEAAFWHHFTNVHIAERARRAAIDCGQACRRIEATIY